MVIGGRASSSPVPGAIVETELGMAEINAGTAACFDRVVVSAEWPGDLVRLRLVQAAIFEYRRICSTVPDW